MSARSIVAERIAGHAAMLERAGRSPLYVELMRSAARSAEEGGVVAQLFGADHGGPAGSAPALRLMAALHHLVLAGRAPELASYYPSAGGDLAPGGAWSAAQAVMADHMDEMRRLIARTVQTNEAGRSVVLFGGLLWLVERHRLPVRLLEIGASAGLNLNVERYEYVVDGRRLGRPGSALVFEEPWRGDPVADASVAASALHIASRAGCDLNPMRLDEEGRLAVLSYIWPDERDRLDRARAAFAVAAEHPPAIEAAHAAPWLARQLAEPQGALLTVVWQSVMWQYVPEADRREVEQAMARAAERATPQRPLAWLAMEPRRKQQGHTMTLRARCWPGGEDLVLAEADDHGPPVTWTTGLSRR